MRWWRMGAPATTNSRGGRSSGHGIWLSASSTECAYLYAYLLYHIFSMVRRYT
jgi:hypothetical protein